MITLVNDYDTKEQINLNQSCNYIHSALYTSLRDISDIIINLKYKKSRTTHWQMFLVNFPLKIIGQEDFYD